MRYLLYGLSVEADHPLPGLSPSPAAGAPDVTMRLGAPPAAPPPIETPWYASPRAAPAGDPTLVVTRSVDGGYRLRYADGIEFSIDRAGTRVDASWPGGQTLEDAATYLLGSVCGFVLRLRGVTSLHASAVAIGDRAIAVTGPAGAGKSTTAAAFAARGFPVLADDVVPLIVSTDGIDVQPAYPHLRLWPDAARALYGDGRELPPLTPDTPGWDKRYLDLSADRGAFHDRPLPLAAVYVLGGRERHDAPRLEPVAPAGALLTLVANTYMGWLPDADARARDFAALSRVAASVPVILAIPHADPGRIDALCGVIAADASRHAETSGEAARGAHG